MTARRLWPPERTPSLLDPVVTIDGVELRRIDGVWCGQTRAGRWRSAAWLGLIDSARLLDIIHHHQQETP